MPMLLYQRLTGFTRKLHWKELLALFFILLAIFFFRQQRHELRNLIPAIEAADSFWFWCGVLVTIVYIFLQAGLYVFSFATVNGKIKWINAIELFVKRNLISVFLPAGGISSLAYLLKTIRKEQVNKQQVHHASAIDGFIAMKATGMQPSFEAAVVGYIVATIFLIISPFLRGLGAIELSLAIILQGYHFLPVGALAITFLFRIFEFWLPLAAGIISFALKGKELFLRLFPPVMIFLLGVINIISVLTPPIASRVKLLKEYIPISSMEATNLLVILMGLTLIITAHFLLRGLRTAWVFALSISIVTCFGNMG